MTSATETPFPLEEEAQTDNDAPRWDPWSGPSKPAWYAGLAGPTADNPYYGGPAYNVASAAVGGLSKGAAVLSGLYSGQWNAAAEGLDALGLPGGEIARGVATDWNTHEQQLRDFAKRLTPDASTNGAAAQMLHGVAESATLMATGALAGGPLGAAAAVGGTEGPNRYWDLKEQGVDTRTAAEAGAVTGITSAAGAVMPAAYGESLLARVITGAASNTAFGVINRYADHTILAANGYTDMAAQQKVLDASQMLADAALGATFGVIHHAMSEPEQVAAKALQTPENRDAALTANLALRDRQAAPGIPVDPEAANAHDTAMRQAGEDLAAGRPVDVSDTGVADADYLSRAERDLTPESKIILQSFRESGLLDEEANLRDLEESLAQRRGEEGPGFAPLRSKEAQVIEQQRHMVDGRPVEEMSADELGAAADRMDAKDVGTLTGIFGNGEDAQRFMRLADSERDSAYAAANKMVKNLTPEKQAAIEEWERGDIHALTAKDLRELQGNLGDVANAATPDELSNSIKHAVTKIGDEKDPQKMDREQIAALMQIKEAHRVAIERGWNTKDISEGALQKAAARFADPNDAAFMLRRFIKPEGGSGEPLDERPMLRIPDENGDSRYAAQVEKEAEAETEKASEFGKAVKVAADCFARRGG